MGRLLEVDYEKIFSPKTMSTLKGKSGESLRSMLGNKSLMQSMRRVFLAIKVVVVKSIWKKPLMAMVGDPKRDCLLLKS
jgi:hypothetical protein